MAESLDADMNGAIVAGMQNTMPIVGGEIVELTLLQTIISFSDTLIRTL